MLVAQSAKLSVFEPRSNLIRTRIDMIRSLTNIYVPQIFIDTGPALPLPARAALCSLEVIADSRPRSSDRRRIRALGLWQAALLLGCQMPIPSVLQAVA